ncbi:MAG TPA: O-antigen ligase family protein [Roseiflexaceae bacterium]|nr:O-antigen ligase family protein [Roseiflexaceae bacterium]HMP39383.1 O-antigen ligase family protein [Roseiflexaceae bacterium]
MRRQSSIVRWCERLIEGGWLLALMLIPNYFNLLSSRHFEPDKATTLRAIVIIMAAAAVIAVIERALRPDARVPEAAQTQPQAGPGIWQRINAFPLALPVVCYVLVFLIATVGSIVPYVSFWGSYQRLQGTYTNLSYVALGVLIVGFLRTRAQIERLVIMATLASLIAVFYGLIQHFQLDPLPWRGDVVSRVASTMGNSIFVAAYMIMIVPFAMALAVGSFQAARQSTATPQPRADLMWAGGYLLIVMAGLALAYAALQFGAVVRTADLRYWWVYPGALIAAGGLFLVPTLRLHTADRIGIAAIMPGVVAIGYILLVGIAFSVNQAGGTQVVQPSPGRGGTEWPFWMIAAALSATTGYGLCWAAPRQASATRLWHLLGGSGASLIALLLLITIFFTQSRGPWIGGAAGIFIFFTLVLLQARRRSMTNADGRERLWTALLTLQMTITVVVATFLVVFNLSQAPLFEQLREVPYIGRMGRLLEVDSGTGLVRRLIWVGDDQTGGAIELIMLDPVRAVIGWGPESMFVAYNRVYPPALANIEARGASPDRSHQAYLDELINKGILGLVSYLFVLVSFFALAWRQLRRIDDRHINLLVIASMSAVASHAVEGLTGIPIVSSLMLFWIALALVVAIERTIGAPAVVAAAVAVDESKPAVAQPTTGRTQGSKGNRRRGGSATGRGAPGNTRSANRREGRGGALAMYAIVGLLALIAAWSLNVDNVYADMRFQQGQTYTERPQATLDQQIIGATFYLDAIRMEPEQDFYYLSLGRSMLSLTAMRAEMARQTPGETLGVARDQVDLGILLRYEEPVALKEFILQQTPLELMSYARAVLERAQQLAPLNKDHYANLGRMYSFWYQQISPENDPALLQQAIEWYRRGAEVAPQDVSILNEYAAAVARSGDYAEAQRLLERSQQLDPRYLDTTVRFGELLRIQGRSAEAVDQYLAALDRNPRILDAQITTIVGALVAEPEQLRRLREGYLAASATRPEDAALHAIIGLISERIGDMDRAAIAFGTVVQLQPDNLEARQNYTIVLSDMLRYDDAAREAGMLLQLAQQQQVSAEDQQAISRLLQYFEQKRAEQ